MSKQGLREKIIIHLTYYVKARDSEDVQEINKEIDKFERLIAKMIKDEVLKVLDEVGKIDPHEHYDLVAEAMEENIAMLRRHYLGDEQIKELYYVQLIKDDPCSYLIQGGPFGGKQTIIGTRFAENGYNTKFTLDEIKAISEMYLPFTVKAKGEHEHIR